MLRLRCCAFFLLQIVSFFLFAQIVSAKSATGNRVLVIHEEDAITTTFSQFFSSMQSTYLPSMQDADDGPARGYQLTFLNPKKDPSATLTKYEERLYDHIVLFPQKLKGIHTSCLAKVTRNLQC